MEFQFVLPTTNAELLNSSGDSYYVKQVYAPNEIGERLRCKPNFNFILIRIDKFLFFFLSMQADGATRRSLLPLRSL